MVTMIMSARLPSFIPNSSSSTIPTTKIPVRTSFLRPNLPARSCNCIQNSPFACNATDSGASITDYDLYDLLGVDSSCDQFHIKLAYRALQKRCHPDIAGPSGHDMAIVLNDAYAVLSDPTTRFAYDKEQAKLSELRGYNGKPLYSVWFGSESEQRAVFVDEIKCVGCLKCALFAGKTFAVESVYGRARVVAQWADPEDKIQEAIQSCPVDCISIVERSNLAALEFLMSKQPRGSVRIGAGNTVSACVSNIFADVEKFQAKYRDAMNKSSRIHAKESDQQREARMSAIHAIRAISNWLYWQSPIMRSNNRQAHQYLTPTGAKSSNPSVDKIRNVAAARKQAKETSKPTNKYMYRDEYWTIPNLLPDKSKLKLDSEASEVFERSRLSKKFNDAKNESFTIKMRKQRNPFISFVPLGMATFAAAAIGLQVRGGATMDIQEHAGGSLALAIVNNSWLQVFLAGLTWYLIGVTVIEIIEAFKISMESTINTEDM